MPNEVAVHHIPYNRQPYDLGGRSAVAREEIQLWYAEKIFMTCVISMDSNSSLAERMAATLTYSHWSQEYCIPDHDQAWGMFTGLEDLRFYRSRHGREWDRTAIFEPMFEVGQVVAYFRREYERVRHYQRGPD